MLCYAVQTIVRVMALRHVVLEKVLQQKITSVLCEEFDSTAAQGKVQTAPEAAEGA